VNCVLIVGLGLSSVVASLSVMKFQALTVKA